MRRVDVNGTARMSEAELLEPIAAAGRLPGYEEAMDERCLREDEVRPRIAPESRGGEEVVRVPERAARRVSDGDRVQIREERRDEGRRERNSQ